MLSILGGTLKPVGTASIVSFTIWRGSYAFLFRNVEQRQEAGLEIRSLNQDQDSQGGVSLLSCSHGSTLPAAVLGHHTRVS